MRREGEEGMGDRMREGGGRGSRREEGRERKGGGGEKGKEGVTFTWIYSMHYVHCILTKVH